MSISIETLLNLIKSQEVVRFKMKNEIITDPAAVEKIDQGVVFLDHKWSKVYTGIIAFDQIDEIIHN